MDHKAHYDWVSDGNEECIIGNWRKYGPYYKVTKNLAELCSRFGVLWKAELASNEIRYLAEEISKQSTEGMAWFLTTYSKMLRRKKWLEDRIIKQNEKKRNQNLKIWEIFSLSILQKMKKNFWKRTLTVLQNDHLIRRLIPKPQT